MSDAKALCFALCPVRHAKAAINKMKVDMVSIDGMECAGEIASAYRLV